MRVADISKYQGAPNFDQLRTAISGIVLRAGYTAPGKDEQLDRNRAEARRVGLPIWYYWFAYPSRKSAAADADDFIRIAGAAPDEGLVLDYEVPEGGPAWCKQFIDRIKQVTGKTCIVYTNQNRTLTLNWAGMRGVNPLWVAIFDNDPNRQVNTGGWPYIMKQYTADGRLPGIVGPVDLNEFKGTAEQFRNLAYNVDMAETIEQPDEVAELIRLGFHREPTTDEIQGLMGKYFYDAIRYLRQSGAGQYMAQLVAGAQTTAQKLEESNRKLTATEQALVDANRKYQEELQKETKAEQIVNDIKELVSG